MIRKMWILLATVALLAPAVFGMDSTDRQAGASSNKPLYVGILIQDNVLRVSNDLTAYRDFVNQLPAGSHVAIAYARTGTNLVVQPFTTNLAQAAEAIRPPSGFSSMQPGSPYVSVKGFLRTFPKTDTDVRKVLVFVSSGLDPIYGIDTRFAPSADPYLNQAIRLARKGDVTIYSIYAPGSAAYQRYQAVAFSGQGALNYLSDQTNGQAFFSGGTYVTARPFLKDIAAKIG